MSTSDDSHFDPDDPRLTAYALGELPDPTDRAHVEALLAASPEARAELADIRSLTAALTAEYEQDRLAADPAEPVNIIHLPDHRRVWLRPLLAAAAMLVAAAILAGLLMPVASKVLVRGARPQNRHVAALDQQAVPPPKTAEAPVLGEPVQELILPKEDPGARLAQNEKPSFEGTAAPMPPTAPAAAPPIARTASPLLAQSKVANPSRVRLPKEITFPLPVGDSARAFTLHDNRASDYPNLGLLNGRRLLAQVDTKTALEGVDKDAKTSEPPFISTTDDQAARPERAREFNTAAYDHVTETPFLTAKENPLSTFSVDVDTASYSIVRRFIEGGSLPPAGAVRIEEMLNYFPYDYAPPAPGDERPFAIHLEGAACPWNPDHRLVRVALKGREIDRDKRPPSNLVFLLDVSGSMEPAERLPLIKESLRLLVEKLTDNDRVAIVVYAGNSGLVLPSTNGAHKDTILRALDRLEAGGSTNGASGIKLAYKVAQENFLKGGTNRVILATDGDFNVGTTSQGELVRLIEKQAKGGVFLSVLGVGTDNLKDSTMQKLADHGNGNYAYLDRIEEGKKVLVEQMSGTLVTIAKDVKIQVEFNPAAVNSYRLIGYEKRLLRKEDFNDDRVDAGEIGAGHSVTALYEVVPIGQTDPGSAPGVDALKYQAAPGGNAPVRATVSPVGDREMLTVKIRHKVPDSTKSERSYEAAFVDHGTAADYANASPDFKFAAAVATFGMVLRDSPYKGNATLGAAIELAQEGKGADAAGYRAGFIELARRAQALSR